MNVRKGNLAGLPANLPDEEIFEELLRTPSFRMERIVSSGHASPPGFWYDQEEDEWVALLQGEAVLEFDDGSAETLRSGDWVFLPAHIRHRVASTSLEPPCIWLAVFARPG